MACPSSPPTTAAAVAEEDAAGLEPVGAEIDEAADAALGTDFLGDDDLVQPVLRGQNGAVLGEMRLQGTHRVTGMVGLDGEDDALELARVPLRQRSLHRLAEGLDGPFDEKAIALHGLHMRLDDIDEEYVVFARAGEIGAEGAADGAGAPDQDRVLVHHQFSISARVSSMATDQMAFMSSSDRWK